jgi:hypothetical protein
MCKRVASVLLALTLCCLSVITVNAAGLTRRWSNIQEIRLVLSFSGGRATADGTVTGNSDTSKITATYSLKEGSGSNWTTVHTWTTKSTSSRSLGFSDSTSAQSGKTYRLYVTTTVTNSSGNSETVTDYLEKKY